MTSTNADPFWDKRWLLLGSCVVIATSIAVFLSVLPTHWRWSLFIWGIVIGAVGFGTLECAAATALRSELSVPEARRRWRRREVMYGGIWLFFGAVAGALSAAFDLPWIDIVLAGYAALSLGAGAIVVAVVRRRTASR